MWTERQRRVRVGQCPDQESWGDLELPCLMLSRKGRPDYGVKPDSEKDKSARETPGRARDEKIDRSVIIFPLRLSHVSLQQTRHYRR